jgi:hypothetical protein
MTTTIRSSIRVKPFLLVFMGDPEVKGFEMCRHRWHEHDGAPSADLRALDDILGRSRSL